MVDKNAFNAVCLRTKTHSVKTILTLTAFLLKGLFWSELHGFDQSEGVSQRAKNKVT